MRGVVEIHFESLRASRADQPAARSSFAKLTNACSTCHRECPADDRTFDPKDE